MNFSKITDDLFIGTTPASADYDTLRNLGVQLVINMRFSARPKPDLHHEPIRSLWLPTIDSPFSPIPIQKLIRGAQSALETIRSGGRVFTHCAYGRHRGVVMGACVLIAQGYDPQIAMDLIALHRSVADPFAYYIKPRIFLFAKQWTNLVKANGHSPLP